jgi:hypothetical protein
MNTADVEGKSRLAAAIESFEQGRSGFLDRLNQEFDLQFMAFSDTQARTTYGRLVEVRDAEGPKTDLSTALINTAIAYPGREVAGMLLVSDGHENAGGDAVAASIHLKSLNTPVWTTTLGATAEAKDVYVTARLNQTFLFRGEQGTLQVDLSQTGFDGSYAEVEVFREETSLAKHQIKFDGTGKKITLPIREEEKGTIPYRVQVKPLVGEADETNNERVVFVRVVDDKARVLVVEAEPYWDSKFLLRALQADPNLEVTSIFQINRDKAFAVAEKILDEGAKLEEPEREAVLPRTKEDLFKYDCILLGKGVDEIYTSEELKLFKAYLEERGGSVVFTRGKSYTGENEVLAQLEPIDWGEGEVPGGRFELTTAGNVNPVFDLGKAKEAGLIIRELPEMISLTQVEEERAAAVVLARSGEGAGPKGIAAISYQRYGKGKVMTVATTGLWRWSFLPANKAEYDKVYARFWGQTIRWLVYGSDFLPGEDISFRTDKFNYDLGETVPLVVHTKETDLSAYRPRIEVTPPVGDPVTLTPEPEGGQPGFFTVSYRPNEEGEYKAVLKNNVGAPKEVDLQFAVYSESVEQRFVSSDRGLMERIAAITGGEHLTRNRWDELPEKVEAFVASTRVETRPEDLWDTLPIFLTLVGLLGLEWLIRRRSGLV